MSIGERIAQLRKEHNISQQQLAKALEISRQAVSKWENDQAAPDTVKLIQLADLLETDTEYLATGKHSVLKQTPQVVTVVQKVDNIVEKVVPIEKVVEVERIVEVEKIVEIPKIKKIIRKQYVRNPIEFVVVGFLAMVVGFLLGLLFLTLLRFHQLD